MGEIQTAHGTILFDDADAALVAKHRWYISLSADTGHRQYRYALSNYKGKKLRMHRFLVNAPKGMCVDHINGNTLDNRRSNLRVCTHAENLRNAKQRSHSQNPYKGIRRSKSGTRWRARIVADGVIYDLGSYSTAEEAAAAYRRGAKRLHGEFANPG